MVNPLPSKSDKSPPWLEATLAEYLVQRILRNKYQLRDSVQFSGVFIFPDLNAQDRKRRNLLRQKLKAVTVTQPFTRFFTRHYQVDGTHFIKSNTYHIKTKRVNALPEQYRGLDVGDVAHILPDSNTYRSHAKQNELGREIFNKLFYVIAHAPLLGMKYYPADVRQMFDKGAIPLSMPLVNAQRL
ncbi:hypothetical protein GJ496_001594 [Pomphorhynchus laevis]|nr:hypothetical protein GJ496_001594 [Pomphorhynchus laevis]